MRANISARYWQPVAKPVDIGISDGASGLPFFTAGGGVNEYYMVVSGICYLNKNWLLSTGIRGSVIVDQRGASATPSGKSLA